VNFANDSQVGAAYDKRMLYETAEIREAQRRLYQERMARLKNDEIREAQRKLYKEHAERMSAERMSSRARSPSPGATKERGGVTGFLRSGQEQERARSRRRRPPGGWPYYGVKADPRKVGVVGDGGAQGVHENWDSVSRFAWFGTEAQKAAMSNNYRGFNHYEEVRSPIPTHPHTYRAEEVQWQEVQWQS
jgi:hypothetical protein